MDGYRARWRGTEYDASPDGGLIRLYSPDPEPGFDEIRPGRYRRLVPVDEVDTLGYVRTIARWRDQPVVIVAQRPGQLLVEYAGGRADTALTLGFRRADLGVYRAWVDPSELADLHEDPHGL